MEVISDTTSYLVKQLGIISFPTAVVIKDGIIVKILDDQYHGSPDLQLILKKSGWLKIHPLFAYNMQFKMNIKPY